MTSLRIPISHNSILRLAAFFWAFFLASCDLGKPEYEHAIRRVIIPQSSAFFSISPDRGHVAYRINRPDGFELILHDTSAGKDYSLLQSGALLTGARFSPDSKYLALYHGLSVSASIAVYDVASRKKLLETGPRFHASSGFSAIVWSKDSDSIFALERLKTLDVSLRRIRIETQSDTELIRTKKRPSGIAELERKLLLLDSERKIFVLDLRTMQMSESPLISEVEEIRSSTTMDGAAIRTQHPTSGSSIHYVEADGQTLERIPDFPAETSSILPFSRDLMAFTSQDGGSHRLRVMRGREILTSGYGAFDTPIAWSQDGDFLTFTTSSLNQPPLTLGLRIHDMSIFEGFIHLNRAIGTFDRVKVESVHLSHSDSVLTVPACTRRSVAAALYVKSAPARNNWIPLVSYLNNLGLPVLVVHLPPTDTGQYTEALNEALNLITKRFGIEPNSILLAGESFGANVSTQYARQTNRPLLGIVDIGGRQQPYLNWQPKDSRVGWIHSFQGEFDTITKDKRPVMALFERVANFPVEYTILNNDGHVIVRLDNWGKIYRIIGEALDNKGLIRRCQS